MVYRSARRGVMRVPRLVAAADVQM